MCVCVSSSSRVSAWVRHPISSLWQTIDPINNITTITLHHDGMYCICTALRCACAFRSLLDEHAMASTALEAPRRLVSSANNLVAHRKYSEALTCYYDALEM